MDRLAILREETAEKLKNFKYFDAFLKRLSHDVYHETWMVIEKLGPILLNPGPPDMNKSIIEARFKELRSTASSSDQDLLSVIEYFFVTWWGGEEGHPLFPKRRLLANPHGEGCSSYPTH